MKWDGQAYAEDIKYGLYQILSNEDIEKASTMDQNEYVDHIVSHHKNDSPMGFSRGIGTGSIVVQCKFDGIEFDFQRTLNNLGDRIIKLTWGMAARHIRAWEFEKKSEEMR